MAAARRIQQKAADRQANSGKGKTWAFMLDSGESATVRFRGLSHDVSDAYSQAGLQGLTMEELATHAVELQAHYTAEMTEEQLQESVLRRYDQTEPVPFARHYIARNKGKRSVGLSAMVMCGDMEAALDGNIRESTQCRLCAARLAGDEGIGWPQTQFAFSVYDYRVKHRITHADGSKEYVPCTMEEDGYCKHCAHNEKLLKHHGVDTFKDLPEKERARYRNSYEGGMRIGEWSMGAASLIDQCAQRVAKVCRSCGTGRIKVSTTYCPACEEEIPLSSLIEAGWRPEAPDHVECPHCQEDIIPEQDMSCTDCDDPVRARLCDVDVTVSKTGAGRSTAWSFTEQLPVRPLDPERERDARVLASPLPDWEEEHKEPDVVEQLKQAGLSEDPLGSVKAEPDEAPTVKRGKKSGSPFGGKRV